MKCRRSVGEVSVKCRRAKSYIGRDTSGTTIDCVSTECRPTIDRLLTAISTEYRPSIDRVSTECRPTVDRLSTDCRPTIDRLSTDCRPLYRPIPRSTLPIVNKIRMIMVQYLSYPVFSLLLSSVSEEGSNRAFFGLDGRNSSSSEMSPSPSSFALLLLSFPADDSCDSLIEACSAASKSF